MQQNGIPFGAGETDVAGDPATTGSETSGAAAAAAAVAAAAQRAAAAAVEGFRRTQHTVAVEDGSALGAFESIKGTKSATTLASAANMASASTDVATISASSVTSKDTTAAPSASSSSNFVMAMSNPAYLQEATTLAASSTVNWRSSPTPPGLSPEKPYPTVPFTSIETSARSSVAPSPPPLPPPPTIASEMAARTQEVIRRTSKNGGGSSVSGGIGSAAPEDEVEIAMGSGDFRQTGLRSAEGTIKRHHNQNYNASDDEQDFGDMDYFEQFGKGPGSGMKSDPTRATKLYKVCKLIEPSNLWNAFLSYYILIIAK